MKILIDGFWIDKPRGMGKYLKELLYALSLYKDEEDIIEVCIPNNISRELLSNFPNIIFKKYIKTPYPFWEQIFIPLLVMKNKYDIVHCPYNTKPIVFNFGYQNHVVTVHDLMFLYISGKSLYQKLGNIYRRIIVKRFSGKSQHIITVSKYSQREIKKKISFDSDVIYTPVSFTYSFFKKESNLNEKLKKWKYFYHIGGINPHKNTERCIKGFIESNLEDCFLVISGMSKKNFFSEKYKSYKNIKFTGWITDAEMASYYKHSLGVVFPSLSEGYGLPIVEAIIFGIPLITSNIAPLNEIAGDAALLINPLSISEISEGMKKILDSAFRKKLIQEGEKRRLIFDSNLMEKKIINIYRKASNIR